jgi:hypothetical protein
MIGTTSAVRQAAYIQRRKNGLQPVATPWDWLTLAEVQKLAKEAYLSVTHSDASDPDGWEFARESLGADLAQSFGVLLADKAQSLGICCAPTDAHEYAARMREAVPSNWRPQYPVYKQVTPTSVLTTPGAVINADEGNVNDSDFTR